MNRVDAHGLKIAPVLFDFNRQGGDAQERDFARRLLGRAFPAIIAKLGPKNRDLLAVPRRPCRPRSTAGHRANKGKPFDMNAYTAFLKGDRLSSCRSLRPTRSRHQMSMKRSARSAGRSWSFPLTNARYALNAANARWGSLYDAFYGTDAIPHDPSESGKGYNKGARRQGDRPRPRHFLDAAMPLATGKPHRT